MTSPEGAGTRTLLLLALGLIVLAASALAVKAFRSPEPFRETRNVPDRMGDLGFGHPEASGGDRAGPALSSRPVAPASQSGTRPVEPAGIADDILAATEPRYSQRRFDPLPWAEGQQSGRPGLDCREMAERIVVRRQLRGMTRAEVVDMLGEPSSSARSTGWDLAYPVGPDARAASTQWLAVRFGQDGKVADFRVIAMGE